MPSRPVIFSQVTEISGARLTCLHVVIDIHVFPGVVGYQLIPGGTAA
jgi:hypothetical protein